MVKKLSLMVYVFLGIIFGNILGFVLMKLMPICGEDCVNEKMKYFLYSIIFSLIYFLALWIFFIKIQKIEQSSAMRKLLIIFPISLLFFIFITAIKFATKLSSVPQISG